MADDWAKWSMFVLKSIERIESAIKTIDETIVHTIEKFNLKIANVIKDIDTKIDIVVKDLRKEFTDSNKTLTDEINKLKIEDKVNSNLIYEHKGKIALVLILVPAVISAIVAIMLKI